MSININVHGNPLNIVNDKFLVNDSEYALKCESERRKKLRLEQVRQQSKEIASRLRKKVKEERKKQLIRVERIKSNELRNWQDKEIDKKQKEYRKCLKSVGEAHLAAAAENKKEIQRKERKIKNDAIAIERGKVAAKKLKDNKAKKNKNVNKKLKSVSTQVEYQCEQSDSSLEEDNCSSSYESNDEDIQKPTVESRHISCENLQRNAKIQNISISSDSESETIVENAKIQIQDDTDISSTESSEIVEIGKKPTELKKIYNHKDFAATSSSESASFPIVAQPSFNTLGTKCSVAPSKHTSENIVSFSEISDLIKSRQIAKEQQRVRFTTDPQLLDISNLIPNKSPVTKSLVSNLPTKSPSLSPQKSVFNSNPIINSNLSSLKEIKSFTKPKSTSTVNKSSDVIKSSYIPPNIIPKVQMYDNWSKYSKEYEAPKNLVLREELTHNIPNAIEEARNEIELERKKSLQVEEMRKREQLRSEKVMEKEQIRKDYELLTTHLEALSKEEKIIRNQIHPENRFSEEKMKQSEREREKRLNTIFEDVLSKPVLITCPIVKEGSQKVDQPESINKLNVASSRYAFQDNFAHQTLNSSDSCSSILLGYVDDRSKELTEHISKIDQKSKSSNIEKLNELLDKINEQKRLLVEELNREKKITTDGMNTALKSLQQWEKEKGIVIRENKEDEENVKKAFVKEKRSLEKREKDLRERELGLEGKIRELCRNEIEKEKQNTEKRQQDKQIHKSRHVEIETHNSSNDESVMSTDSLCTYKEVPVKIIIKLNEKGKQRKPSDQIKILDNLRKSSSKPCSSPRKTPRKSPRKAFPKTPIKRTWESELRNNIVKPIKSHLETPFNESVTTSTSTAYRSPPNHISNQLEFFFGKSKNNQLKEKPIKDTITINKNIPKDKQIHEKTAQDQTLSYYINKLLGMSRQSIDCLDVSSISDVPTPSDSIINVSTNISEHELSIDNERVQRMKKFIMDNYSFASNNDNSFKKNSSSDDSGIKEIQELLKRSFENKTKKLKPALKKTVTEIEMKVPTPETNKKTILKSPTKDLNVPKVLTKIKEKISKSLPEKNNLPKVPKIVQDDSSREDRYNELTENCTQRIANLSKLITKVREQKQHSIESSNSSSDRAQNSTEYLEFATGKVGNGSNDSSHISDLKSLSYREDLPMEEAAKKLSETKQIGASRDSGISVSRPMTSTDLRDSPDVRSNSEIETIQRDIHKIADKLGLEDFLMIAGNLDAYKEMLEKRNRPPISLRRYSPKLDEEQPHELSTIAEVETPGTSRINISVNPTLVAVDERNNTNLNISEINENIQYKKFPTYDEYAQNEQLNYLNNRNDRNNTNNELDYKKFPTRSEYNKEKNISTGLMDSVNLEASDNNIQSIGSDSSLPDVVAELKRRNILQHSFDNSPNRSKTGSPVDDLLLFTETINMTPTQSISVLVEDPKSPKKRQAEMKLGLKTPQNRPIDEKDKILTPVKQPHSPIKIIRPPKKVPEETKQDNQEHSLSGIGILSSNTDHTMEELEKDLDNVDLKWASNMLKTTKKSLALQSSSNSSTNLENSGRQSPQKSWLNTTNSFVDPNIACSSRRIIESSFVSDDSSCNGKPLNLKEFLAREIMKKKNTDNNSSSNSNSSSLASLFLKSLLAVSPSVLDEEKVLAHRTSTPVTKISSSASSKIFSLNGSSGLFSGESKLSSVRQSPDVTE